MLKLHPAPTTYWEIVAPDFRERYGAIFNLIFGEQSRPIKASILLPRQAKILGATATLRELGFDPWSELVGHETREGESFADLTLKHLKDHRLLVPYGEGVEVEQDGVIVVQPFYDLTPIGKAVAAPLLAVEQLRQVHKTLETV